MLNEKLNLLQNTLSIESEALLTPAKEGVSHEGLGNAGNGNGKQKMFVPREALMSRANSLKKALKQIIEHAEQGMWWCYKLGSTTFRRFVDCMKHQLCVSWDFLLSCFLVWAFLWNVRCAFR